MGRGPALVLLHPSPNSSNMMLGLAKELAANYTVICPDTPGYGSSYKLSVDSPAMTDYVKAFHSLFESIGIESLAIYGSATGAQLAIRYGLQYPSMVNHLYLDNCAHFSEEERVSIMSNYFPDLSPREDGSHIVKIWQIVTNLFKYFPWCNQTEKYKIKAPLPPAEILHSIAIDYLKAGKDYDLAYKAAFEHEKVDYIQSLTVPTTILRWEVSILKKYTDRLFEYELPACVDQALVPAKNRYGVIAQTIIKDAANKEEGGKKFIINTDECKEYKEDNIGISDYQPPSPLYNGSYLVRAWHELKDTYTIFNNEYENRSDEELAAKVQLELVKSYS